MTKVEEQRGRFDRLFWSLSALCFGLGFWVGMQVHARAGALLWVASCVFALLPFAEHRHRV